jgi:hypothetical protein
MKTTRRTALFGGLAAAGMGSVGPTLSGCSLADAPAPSALTKVTVLGLLHSVHRTSERFSLDVLRAAVRRISPDVVLTEIPPDRIDAARDGFRTTGKITEPRTRVFPEYTDVLFPLTRDMDFTIVGTSGWTQELADERAAALKRIERDPARAPQWAEHRAAQSALNRALAGRSDDPRFIHTRAYDVLIQRAQTPYQIYFDPDLGPGGWTRINAAHTGLIDAALDRLRGRGLNVLITFGGWHKYMIERALLLRSDVAAQDARALFA